MLVSCRQCTHTHTISPACEHTEGAKLANAAQIIAIDIVPLKLQYAKQFGATDLVDGSKVNDTVAEVMRLTGGKGVDYAFDAIGSSKVIEQMFAMIKA